jgi:hypothetical protein
VLALINPKRNNTVFNLGEFVVKFWLTLLAEIPTDDFKNYLYLENLKYLLFVFLLHSLRKFAKICLGCQIQRSCLSVCNDSNTVKWLFINLILENFTKICQYISLLIENRTEINNNLHEDLRVSLHVFYA